MKQPGHDLIDVQEAALAAGRSPETVRRWVWSGRLPARRLGRRLMIARGELDALIGLGPEGRPGSLAAWLTEMDSQRGTSRRRRPSAADLVLEDRTRRSNDVVGRARR